jgi:hypothetical protein
MARALVERGGWPWLIGLPVLLWLLGRGFGAFQFYWHLCWHRGVLLGSIWVLFGHLVGQIEEAFGFVSILPDARQFFFGNE